MKDERDEDRNRILGHERDFASLLFAELHYSSKKWLRKYPKIVVWWGTSVEINSGLARLKRDDHLTGREAVKALYLWERLRKTCRIVSPVERVIELANDLPGNYGLRALDSFQLCGGTRLVSGKTAPSSLCHG